jgi:hypothetical protein
MGAVNGWRVVVKCNTWQAAAVVVQAQVAGKVVTLRGRGSPEAGARVELRLDLPDGRFTTVPGTVVKPAGDGRAHVKFDEPHFRDYSEIFSRARVESGPEAPEEDDDPAAEFGLASPSMAIAQGTPDPSESPLSSDSPDEDEFAPSPTGYSVVNVKKRR